MSNDTIFCQRISGMASPPTVKATMCLAGDSELRKAFADTRHAREYKKNRTALHTPHAMRTKNNELVTRNRHRAAYKVCGTMIFTVACGCASLVNATLTQQAAWITWALCWSDKASSSRLTLAEGHPDQAVQLARRSLEPTRTAFPLPDIR